VDANCAFCGAEVGGRKKDGVGGRGGGEMLVFRYRLDTTTRAEREKERQREREREREGDEGENTRWERSRVSFKWPAGEEDY